MADSASNIPGTDISTAYNFYNTDGTIDMNKFSEWGSNPANATAAADFGSKGLSFDNAGVGTITSPTTSSTNWGMDGWGGFGLEVGQLGLGIASYLDNKKTAGKQRNLMDQEAKQNDYNYNKTVADNKHIQQIFNPNNQ